MNRYVVFVYPGAYGAQRVSGLLLVLDSKDERTALQLADKLRKDFISVLSNSLPTPPECCKINSDNRYCPECGRRIIDSEVSMADELSDVASCFRETLAGTRDDGEYILDELQELGWEWICPDIKNAAKVLTFTHFDEFIEDSTYYNNNSDFVEEE